MYTYDNYCQDINKLAALYETFLFEDVTKENNQRLLVLSEEAIKIHSIIDSVKDKFSGFSVSDIVKSFRTSGVYEMLKSFSFSVVKIVKAIHQAISFLDAGLTKAFQEIHNSGAVKKIRQGAMKVDDLLDKYPILKKLTGPVIAGILIMIWLNMSFTGSLSFDMDLSDAFKALVGKFSIDQIFASPEGNKMLLLLATGILSSGVLSFPWLVKTSSNLVLAITYTAMKNYKNIPSLNNIKRKIINKNLGESRVKPFEEFITEQKDIEASLNEVLYIMSTTNEEIEYLFGETINEASVANLAASINTFGKKLGLHGHKSKGLIDYIKSASIGLGKLIIAAIRGDTQTIKEIASSITKEEVLDFLLKLDMATLHLITGPIHTIDAITGWHIWANIKEKIVSFEDVARKVKEAIQKAKEGIARIFTDKRKNVYVGYLNKIESDIA